MIDFGNGWYYDFEKMNVEEVLRAKAFFELYYKGLDILPATITEERVFLTEMNEFNALASLLKKEGSYSYEDAKEYLKTLSGKEVWDKIEQAKQDFFSNTPIGQVVSTREFRKFIETLKVLPEGIANEVFRAMVDLTPELLMKFAESGSQKGLEQDT